MSNYVNRADATVALKSFGRRYSDLISGPAGDDAWERLVRSPGERGKSAVDYVANAIDELALFASIAPLAAQPTAIKSALPEQRVAEAVTSHSISELQAMVKSVSAAAALALDARRDEDYDNTMVVGGVETSLGQTASELVTSLGANLRHGEAAIDEAR
jgi:hypothetical protein